MMAGTIYGYKVEDWERKGFEGSNGEAVRGVMFRAWQQKFTRGYKPPR
jgi:hypothetical protein